MAANFVALLHPWRLKGGAVELEQHLKILLPKTVLLLEVMACTGTECLLAGSYSAHAWVCSACCACTAGRHVGAAYLPQLTAMCWSAKGFRLHEGMLPCAAPLRAWPCGVTV